MRPDYKVLGISRLNKKSRIVFVTWEPNFEETYKFRAECQEDIDRLFELLPPGIVKWFEITPFPDGPQFPDRECTITTIGLKKRNIKAYMRQVKDGHVMVETLALKNKYTGERTYKE